MDISVIVVNWNAGSVLEDCLRTIIRELEMVAGECLVVDNGSQADEVQRLQQRFPQITLLANSQNLGFARAVNQGIRRSQGRHLMLLNPDAALTHGSLLHLMSCLDTQADIGVIGPRIMNEDGTIQGSARTFPGVLTAFFGRTSFLTRHFPNNPFSGHQIQTLKTQIEGLQPVDWVSGACMLIRRQALEEVGELDEQFFLYWEDADLCWRIHEQGWDVVYDPQVYVTHLVGVSSKRAFLRSLIAFHQSAYRFYRKHVTRACWHPLNALAALGLSVRALVLLLGRGVQELGRTQKKEM